MTVDHRALIERVALAMNRRDYESIRDAYTDDFYDVMPQSGEVTRGFDNLRATLENYPGGLPDEGVTTVEVASAEDRWVVTPMFTLQRVDGTGDVGTVELKVRYADGTEWWCVILYRLRDGRFCRTTTYYAPPFDAPDWRAPFVEQVAPDSP